MSPMLVAGFHGGRRQPAVALVLLALLGSHHFMSPLAAAATDQEAGSSARLNEVWNDISATFKFLKNTEPGQVSEGSKGDGDRETSLARVSPQRSACKASTQAAEAFLRSWIEPAGADVCGNWHTTYAALHRDIRSGSSDSRKFVTFARPTGAPPQYVAPGLGAHLLGMVSAFLVGLLTDRAFVMEDSALTAAVDPAEVDWSVRADVPTAEGSVVDVAYYNKGPWKDAVRFPANDTLETFRAMEDVPNIRIKANGGVLARIFADRGSKTYRALFALGLRPTTAFGCIVRFLLRPKEEVWRLVLPQVADILAPHTATVGIHLRTSDKFAWRGTGLDLDSVLRYAEGTLFPCAEETSDFHVPGGSWTWWLFLSDSQAVRESIHERYRGKLLETGIVPEHPRYQRHADLRTALAEWLLLSTCQYFVITETGYAKTAAAYNLREPTVFLFGHLLWGQGKGSCDQAAPSSILDFSRWSGL